MFVRASKVWDKNSGSRSLEDSDNLIKGFKCPLAPQTNQNLTSCILTDFRSVSLNLLVI